MRGYAGDENSIKYVLETSSGYLDTQAVLQSHLGLRHTSA